MGDEGSGDETPEVPVGGGVAAPAPGGAGTGVGGEVGSVPTHPTGGGSTTTGLGGVPVGHHPAPGVSVPVPPTGAVAARRVVGSRAVEVIPRPVWSSFSVDHMRRFLDAERQYKAQLAATGGAPPSLFELVDSDFLPAIPAWVRGRTGAVVKPARDLVAADLALWEANVRGAIHSYLSDPALVDLLNAEEVEAQLLQVVHWPADLPTFLESGTQFAAMFAVAHERLRLDTCYLTTAKNKRRCVSVLVSMLQPAKWRREVELAVMRKQIVDPAALFAHLSSREEERAYLAYKAAAGGASDGSGAAGFSRGRRVSFVSDTGRSDAGSSVGDGGFVPRPPPRGVVDRLRSKVWHARGGGGAGGYGGGPPREVSTVGPCWGCGRLGHRVDECRSVDSTAARERGRQGGRPSGHRPRASFNSPSPSGRGGRGRGGFGGRESQREGRVGGTSTRTSSPSPRFHRSRRVVPGVGVSQHDGYIAHTSLWFLLDSGCTANFISPAAAAELLCLVPGATTEALSSPIVVGTVAAEGHLTATVRVCATVRLLFTEGSAWTLADCEFLVVPGLSDDDVLLGRPVIASLPASLVQRVYLATGSTQEDTVPQFDMSAQQLLRQAAVVDTAASDAVEAEVLAAEDDGGVDIGVNDADAVRATLQRALDAAAAEGLSPAAVRRLSDAVMGPLFDAFRLRMCGDPPASVPPVVVRFVPGVRPVRSKPRRYSVEDSAYMRETMDELVRLGYVYKNNSATWSSPAFPVRKANVSPSAPLRDRFRMCVDLRAVNRVTVEMCLPIPRLETIVERLGGHVLLGSLDLAHGYWQCALAEECQEQFTIVTDVGCYTPRRLVQGSRNGAGPFFQAVIDVLGDLLDKCCVVYIDDVAVFGSTEEELIENWLLVVGRLLSRGIRVSAQKVVFYSTALRFCGRVFTREGVRFDPAFIRSVASMPPPTTAAQLASYLATVNWARLAVPRFAEETRVLQELLTSVLKSQPSATKHQRQAIVLSECGWTSVHSQAFARVNAIVVQNTALAYPREGWTISVWFDASDIAWGGVVCQSAPSEVDVPPHRRAHEPLAFLSGIFKGAQVNYSVVERECLAFVMVCQKAAHLLRRPGGFVAFTDHRNLQYLLSPDPSVAASRRQAAARVERWAVFLRSFDFTIVHVAGELNAAADLLSRWGVARDVETTATTVPAAVRARVVTRRQAASSGARVVQPVPSVVDVDSATGPAGAGSGVGAGEDPGAPAAAPSGHSTAASRAAVFATPSDVLDFSVADCPMLEEIIAAQYEAVRRDGVPPNTHLDGEGVRVSTTSRVWVPDVQCLRLRLVVVAHQGPAAHRGVETTLRALQAYFYWPTMASDVATFVSGCLFCVQVRGGGRVPRPLGSTITATAPGQELRFDFAYVRPPAATDGHEYRWILTLQDSFSRFVELIPAVSAESGVVVTAILGWYARFGHARRWVSDGGSHMVNQVLDELRRVSNTDHHVVVSYASQANGQVERVHREVWTALRAMCAESRLDHGCWPSLLPIAAAVINHSPCSVLDGLAPVTVHCGLPAINPVAVAFLPTARELRPVDITSVNFRAHVTQLQEQLSGYRQRVLDTPARSRARQPGERPVDFEVGCYVVVALRGDKQRRDKLAVRWRGPARVVGFVGPLVAKVQDLVTGDVSEVHCQHLKRYADKDLVVSKQLVAFAAHSGSGFVVRAFLDHRLSPTAELLVSWEGFSAEEDSWEPMSVMLADVPAAVRQYARTVQDRKRRQELLDYLERVG